MGVLFVRGLVLSVALVLAGCGAAESSRKPEAASDVPHRRDADDVARFIAGLPGSPGSTLAALEQTDAWKQHQRQLDDAWAKADRSLVQKLTAFQASELNDSALTSAPVFYPFGGPDALTMTAFFPHAPTYVMVGLEPAGTLPSAAELAGKDTAAYLAATRETVASVLQRSFFITKQMDQQLRGQVADGLLLPILHLLVRRGDAILGYRYVRLDDKGNVIDRPADYKAPGRFGNKGVEIEFHSPTEPRPQRLFYFSVNLADDRLTENTPFLAHLAKLKGSTTLLKATSYMPHNRTFSLIRGQILAISGAILQDDSGIPYRYLNTPEWKTQLYGAYTHPYGSFAWIVQPDLQQAFAKGAKPLDLRLSYGYSKAPSNLLLAKRR